jgi:hypothetical protein
MYVLVPRRLRKPFTLVKIFDKWGRANEHAVSHLAYRFDSLSHDGRGIWPDRVSENGKDHFREKNGFPKKIIIQNVHKRFLGSIVDLFY